MTTTVYIMMRPIGAEYIASCLSKHFKTQVIAVEEKSTPYMKDLYMVQFAEPLAKKAIDAIWEYGAYRLWPEPTLMIQLYIDCPQDILPEHFISQKRYVIATDTTYYKHLNHEDSKCYIYDKLIHKYTVTSETPFVF